MEKAALDDPFLADAMEGYSTEGVVVAQEISSLKQRLADRIEGKDDRKVIGIAPVRSFPWLRVAALFVLIAGTAFMIYQFTFRNENKQPITQAKNRDTVNSRGDLNAIQKESNAAAVYDSTTAINGNISSQAADAKADRSFADHYYKDQLAENSPLLLPGDSIIVSSEAKEEKAFNGDVAPTQKAKSFGNTLSNGSATRKDDKLDSLLAGRVAGVEVNAEAQGYDQAMHDKLRRNTRVNQSAKPQFKFTDNNSNNASNGVVFNSQSNAFASRTNIFRGRVTDNFNNALPFANITNTADNVGTYSDARGNFTLISPDSILNVQVRSVGFENNTIQLQNTVTDNQVVMQEDRSLSEVVVSTKKSPNSKRERTSTMVLEEPEPVDGWVNYDTYLANNLNLPDNIKNKQTTGGEVRLSFEINKNGEPVNITIDQSLCASCDKEAIRLVKEGPKWKRKARKKRTTVTISF